MEQNKTNCPICYAKITPNDEQTACPNCQMVYHKDCWKDNNGCATYGCRSAGCLNPPPMKIDLSSEVNVQHSSKNNEGYVCPKCHTKLVGGTTLCWSCGSELKNAQHNNDSLGNGAVACIYVSSFLCSIFPAAIVCGILYYRWRKDYPNKAARLNRHLWIAFGIQIFLCIIFKNL